MAKRKLSGSFQSLFTTRKKRPCDVEPVFGNIKNNHHFKRFMLRGKSKAIEAGLLALAKNLRKKVA